MYTFAQDIHLYDLYVVLISKKPFSFQYPVLRFVTSYIDKRIPASILLTSPWFHLHEINAVEDAISLMKVYLDSRA